MKTKTRILQVTWNLLEENKSESVRMFDIARGAKVSRQALYLHFDNRTELLIATTRYIDEVKQVDNRLKASRAAASGEERLVEFIVAWGNYIPEIYGVGSALMALSETDEAASAAWNNRMEAVQQGCNAAIKALAKSDQLSPDFTIEDATEMLWMLLSVGNWEQLRHKSGWSQEKYISHICLFARKTLMSACG